MPVDWNQRPRSAGSGHVSSSSIRGGDRCLQGRDHQVVISDRFEAEDA